ncbi:hypothetical protein NHX12_005672 [Muraenolepis orangiensis]|uniref:Uncharacterized protein n=1 Tax=Muraenolepis orangiensis TaxID=630683 RepID=A0A9Q0IAK5_9TELE|nr:hypothetical protein NHX12_005672 [Muraenolepis orangiensis]
MMATAEDLDQEEEEEEEEEESPAEDDCSTVGLQTDRWLVDALLDMSMEYSLKEQEPCDLYYSSGWEEAVQGWRKVTPLGCMFVPQRRQLKPKYLEQDPHCLLCVDMTPPGALHLDTPNTPESCPESHGSPQDRLVTNATATAPPRHQVRLQRSTETHPGPLPSGRPLGTTSYSGTRWPTTQGSETSSSRRRRRHSLTGSKRASSTQH